MTVLERLNMELANRQYLSEGQYKQYLIENNLDYEASYNKDTMQRDLLYTVIDILNAVCNDTDTMKSVTTEFETIGRAYEYLQQRIQEIRNKIASLPDEISGEESGQFSLMYTNSRKKWYRLTPNLCRTKNR